MKKVEPGVYEELGSAEFRENPVTQDQVNKKFLRSEPLFLGGIPGNSGFDFLFFFSDDPEELDKGTFVSYTIHIAICVDICRAKERQVNVHGQRKESADDDQGENISCRLNPFCGEGL